MRRTIYERCGVRVHLVVERPQTDSAVIAAGQESCGVRLAEINAPYSLRMLLKTRQLRCTQAQSGYAHALRASQYINYID